MVWLKCLECKGQCNGSWKALFHYGNYRSVSIGFPGEKIEIKNNKRLIIETEEINDIKNNEGTDDIKNSEVKEEIKDIINNEDKNKEILDKINPMIELHNKKDELKAMVMSRILENNLIVKKYWVNLPLNSE